MTWFAKTRAAQPVAGPVSPQESSPSDGRGSVESLTRQIGGQLLQQARQQRSGMFSARFWSDRLMHWAMKDPAFKVELFRFVDAFPMLKSPASVHECLVEYLTQPGVTLPPGMELGLKAGGLAKGLLSGTIGRWIATLAGNFIAGTDAASALPKLEQLWQRGAAFTVDLLGEACLSAKEAAEYRERYLDLLRVLPQQVRQWKPTPALESDYLGPVPRVNLSIKISSLDARTDPTDTRGSVERLLESLRPILESARDHGALVNFDMEQFALKDLTIDLLERCCEEIDFAAGIAIQAYLRSGEEDVRRLIAWTKRTGRQVTVRLIKGAYWDYEVVYAEQMGWPVPVWTRKRDTDACFERMADLLLAAAPRRAGEGGMKLALGSHNIRSIAHTLALLEKYELPPSAVDLQMLYGMADQLKPALRRAACACGNTCPSGRWSPAWPISSAACWKTRPTNRGSAPASSTTCRTRPCWPRRTRRPRRQAAPRPTTLRTQPGSRCSIWPSRAWTAAGRLPTSHVRDFSQADGARAFPGGHCRRRRARSRQQCHC